MRRVTLLQVDRQARPPPWGIGVQPTRDPNLLYAPPRQGVTCRHLSKPRSLRTKGRRDQRLHQGKSQLTALTRELLSRLQPRPVLRCGMLLHLPSGLVADHEEPIVTKHIATMLKVQQESPVCRLLNRQGTPRFAGPRIRLFWPTRFVQLQPLLFDRQGRSGQGIDRRIGGESGQQVDHLSLRRLDPTPTRIGYPTIHGIRKRSRGLAGLVDSDGIFRRRCRFWH